MKKNQLFTVRPTFPSWRRSLLTTGQKFTSRREQMPLRQNPATLPVLKTEDLKQTGQDIYVQCHSPCSAIQIVSALALACSHLQFQIFRSCLSSNLHEFHLTRQSVPVLWQNLDLHLHFLPADSQKRLLCIHSFRIHSWKQSFSADFNLMKFNVYQNLDSRRIIFLHIANVQKYRQVESYCLFGLIYYGNRS